jgi:hypothetical protein
VVPPQLPSFAWPTVAGRQIRRSHARRGGTATNYAGLYNVVQTFSAPTAEAMRGVPDHFPERAVVSGLVDTMVEIDEHWEHLKTLRAAGYQLRSDTRISNQPTKPSSFGNIIAKPTSARLRAPRLEFCDEASSGGNRSREAERLLRYSPARPSQTFASIWIISSTQWRETCASCHQAYRDHPTKPQ